MNRLKVATFNTCLGVIKKKNEIERILKSEELDILFVQEAEVTVEKESFLNIPGYLCEIEKTDQLKARTMCYVKDCLIYRRLYENETANRNVIILKVNQALLVGLYRPFKMIAEIPRVAFEEQLKVISDVLIDSQTDVQIVLGDLNVDYNRIADPTYNQRAMADVLASFIEENELKQLVKENTWCRMVQNTLKVSLLDHCYVRGDPYDIEVKTICSSVSDHVPVVVTLHMEEPFTRNRNFIDVRVWRNYSSERLIQELAKEDFDIKAKGVNEFNEELEQKIMKVFDLICPVRMIKVKERHAHEPHHIQMLRSKLKNLFKNAKRRQSPELFAKVKKLKKKIEAEVMKLKNSKVHELLNSCNQKSFWNIVNSLKGRSHFNIPGEIIDSQHRAVHNRQDQAQAFADFFQQKISMLGAQVHVDNSLQLESFEQDENIDLVTEQEIEEIMRKLQKKKSCGYDGLPVKILCEAAEILKKPYTKLVNKIIITGEIPDSWKIARIVPLHKKESRSQIHNYRPISNLCSSSKIFERVILSRIQKFEEFTGRSITGETQHGFKKGRSTVTAMIDLQSQIGNALDQNEFVACASIDLSAAFDLVDVKELERRLKSSGLPVTLVHLVTTWLSNRFAFVEVDGYRSDIFKIEKGTVQGSILGPVLFAIFIEPIVTFLKLVAFADDNYVLGRGMSKGEAIASLKRRLLHLIEWLKKSGMKVNSEKTEFIVFHKNDVRQVEMDIDGQKIKSKQVMNVLGVLFDNRLKWDAQVHKAITSANKALYGIRFIKSFFNKEELKKLLTAYYFSKLYYSAPVWLLPSLKATLKQKLLSASARALKLVCPEEENFVRRHAKMNRATPEMWMRYCHAVNLKQIMDSQYPPLEWSSICTNIMNSERNDNLLFTSSNRLKVGINCFSNRLSMLSNKIPSSTIFMEYKTFKSTCKKIFLDARGLASD